MDAAADPELFAKVVSGAIGPVFEKYRRTVLSKVTKEQLSADPAGCSKWISSRLAEHANFGGTPSRYGNSLMREANAMISERAIREFSPQIFEELHLHYEQYLTLKGLEGGFVRHYWEGQLSMFEIDGMFVDHWHGYLKTIAVQFGLGEARNLPDAILQQWRSVPGVS